MLNQNPVPTHKHLALWTISFIALLVIALLFWGWTSRNPVGGEMIEKYNTELNTNVVENTQNNTQADPATQALENDINSSLDLEVESDLKSIDLEF
jgi:FtsZ-interacting cell division protein ZipA